MYVRAHLLHLWPAVLVRLLQASLGEHLLLCVNVHRHLEELFVEERHARLEAPGHGRLVGPQAVGSVQVLDSLDALLVERVGIWCSVEVEVACVRVRNSYKQWSPGMNCVRED